ncbi:MAG: DUF885 domain-containing protein [bacterium]
MRSTMFFLAVVLLAACGKTSQQPNAEAKAERDNTLNVPVEVSKKVPSEDQKIEVFFEKSYQDMLHLSPEGMTYRGLDEGMDRWDERTPEAAEQRADMARKQLEIASEFKPELLSEVNKISLDLFKLVRQRSLDNYQFRLYSYPVSQMRGEQSQVAAFLINIHQVRKESDAEAYISRLNKIGRLFDQVIEQLKKRANQGIIVPKFAFPYVLDDSQNIISGQPFDGGPNDSTLYADIKKKINRLEIAQEQKQKLINKAREALLKSVQPAYKKLIIYLQQLEKQAGTDDGVWRFEKGAEFYANRLRFHTTTDMTADEIHQLGLKEVARIHAEMQKIMDKVHFEGDLPAFFKFMRNDPQFYYPETDAGKAAYLKKANEIIAEMKTHLPELFNTLPKADLIVKAVEPFREKSAGKAFYQRPSADGSRPGTYYANLYKMSAMPTYQMEALAYHEAIPGHHMQLSIATELKGIPEFRKYSRFNAYSEGWGLYSEKLPKEIGLYEDPYSDFGRLAMELWRACRLVVDTGIHAKKWTREQAINYLDENTPNPHSDAVKAIERYIVMPGQATAYKIGMMKILELRAEAKQRLGDKFDIREFHDVILKNGMIPLGLMEQQVDSWVEQSILGEG